MYANWKNKLGHLSLNQQNLTGQQKKNSSEILIEAFTFLGGTCVDYVFMFHLHLNRNFSIPNNINNNEKIKI